mgnify:CR=1 FL=1
MDLERSVIVKNIFSDDVFRNYRNVIKYYLIQEAPRIYLSHVRAHALEHNPTLKAVEFNVYFQPPLSQEMLQKTLADVDSMAVNRLGFKLLPNHARKLNRSIKHELKRRIKSITQSCKTKSKPECVRNIKEFLIKPRITEHIIDEEFFNVTEKMPDHVALREVITMTPDKRTARTKSKSKRKSKSKK